jgi:hypothetical protein
MEKTPGAHVEGRPLYHIRMDLSIGKMHKKISPQNRGEIFVKIHNTVSKVCQSNRVQPGQRKIYHSV